MQPAAIPNGAGKDPDWKAILTELVTTLERYGDRLPLLVLSQMRGVEKVLDLQLGQLPPSEPMAPAAKRYHVKKRTKSNTTDFIVMRDGDKSRYRVQSFRYRKRSPGGLRGVEHVARCQHRRQLDWASAGQGHGIPPFRSPIGEEPEHETLDTAHVQRSGLDGRGVRQATSILRFNPRGDLDCGPWDEFECFYCKEVCRVYNYQLGLVACQLIRAEVGIVTALARLGIAYWVLRLAALQAAYRRCTYPRSRTATLGAWRGVT